MKIYKQTEIDELAEILKNDGVISVPTDTVYGLCARINSKCAYDNLQALKNRPSTKSFPVMCKDKEQIKAIGIVDEKTEKLIDNFMPGAITLVLNKKIDTVNNQGDNDTEELAVRMVPNEIIKELITKVGRPIFMTSANKSGELPCESINEIKDTFPDLAGILDGTPSFGEASTIVDCTKDDITIQRKGPITMEEINNYIKKI